MRTGAEIVERIQKHSDRLGFTAEVLAPFLTAEEVLPLCKVDVDLSQEWLHSLFPDEARALAALLVAAADVCDAIEDELPHLDEVEKPEDPSF